ncbi:LOW QUALITY PROTEIN: hypothetical protein CVT26_010400 [Gymnopilus dilepis]|uniref:Uncharacterized protein n=1 Tax=Gymnopilus dilepis TaxID=231916 RepID=A0A409VZ72_9AGAR|nr:LOW QUALITY PROTEIN: hypothetical protein CVT26_010400 [Gymnopilus dilepis]
MIARRWSGQHTKSTLQNKEGSKIYSRNARYTNRHHVLFCYPGLPYSMCATCRKIIVDLQARSRIYTLDTEQDEENEKNIEIARPRACTKRNAIIQRTLSLTTPLVDTQSVSNILRACTLTSSPQVRNEEMTERNQQQADLNRRPTFHPERIHRPTFNA